MSNDQNKCCAVCGHTVFRAKTTEYKEVEFTGCPANITDENLISREGPVPPYTCAYCGHEYRENEYQGLPVQKIKARRTA